MPFAWPQKIWNGIRAGQRARSRKALNRRSKAMIGAIAGDIIGSVYEHRPIKTKDFPLFHDRSTYTDDTVLTVAVADAILSGTPYAESIRRLGRRYPHAGYGGSFFWIGP
jgi:ADP-ribosylglycohydrolase